MPELPEVETTRRGILPHIKGKKVSRVLVRQKQLRWPIPLSLSKELPTQRILAVRRRGKYLLIESENGNLLIHLGMSGSLRILKKQIPPAKHDHLDILFDDNSLLRYTDPRRFGCILWQHDSFESHPLIKSMGPEPLEDGFNGGHLYKQSRGRKAPIKTFIMDGKIVVGVGNIYANESLFMAGISPKRAAGKISLLRYEELACCIKKILATAIEVGGTTLKDFTNSEGEPGYFKQALQVYGRGGKQCMGCKQELIEIRLGQRSTVYCKNCQK